MPNSLKRRALAYSGLIFLLAGCSTVRTRTPEGESVTMTESEFATYVEHVFRHHNRVYSELINELEMIEEEQKSTPSAALLTAETSMLNACLPVNETVSAISEGRNPGMRTKMQLTNAVPECERATRRVEKLIPEDFSEISGNHPRSKVESTFDPDSEKTTLPTH